MASGDKPTPRKPRILTHGMDWQLWHHQYKWSPALQARLRLVSRAIARALDESPAGPISLLSLCAGDGRDVIEALRAHRRRNDVRAVLLDTDAEALERARQFAREAELESHIQPVLANAGRSDSYTGHVPASIAVLSGFLGHLEAEASARLLDALPALCAHGGWVVWSRHLRLNDGENAVASLRARLRQNRFDEVQFEITDPEGFAVGRARFCGEPRRLEPGVVLFEVEGVARLEARQPPARIMTVGRAEPATPAGEPTCLRPVEQTLPERFADIVRSFPDRVAIGTGHWRPTYRELDAAARNIAAVLQEHNRRGERAVILMRQQGALFAAMLGALHAGCILAVLDAGDPPERLDRIVADAAPSILLTDPAHRAQAARWLQPGRELIELDSEARLIRRTLGSQSGKRPCLASDAPENRAHAVTPDDLAVLI